MAGSENLEELCKLAESRIWRLQNLYWIIDKRGYPVLFKPNWAQLEMLENLHHRNVVLKARQLGLTTLFAIWYLDQCFWVPNTSAAIISHKTQSAQDIFRDKVKYAYDNMPKWTKKLVTAKRDNVRELRFSNDSVFRVDTSFRGGTLQLLHISEFGKICRERPDAAREIVTGAFNAVPLDGVITIESTAEGRSGYFYDYCQSAEKLQKEERPLLSTEQKFFFFPWWKNPEYVAPVNDKIHELNEYWFDLEQREIRLTPEQKSFYYAKYSEDRESVKQEYPSYPEEAFAVANEAYWYGQEIAAARVQKRICRVPHDPAVPVQTVWDLGMGDSTAIWTFQVAANEVHFIDYYECSGESLAHYADYLNRQPYTILENWLPPDVNVRELGTGLTRLEQLRALGLNVRVLPRLGIADGINNARNIFHKCYFDRERCHQGLEHLEAYSKTWNNSLGCWVDRPKHDQHSHGADAFRYACHAIRLATNYDFTAEDEERLYQENRIMY